MATLLETLKRQGLGTAVIATKSITDATPASFVAQPLSRSFQTLIAEQLVSCAAVDILLVGGRRYFEDIAADGYLRINDSAALLSLCAQVLPVLGLFAQKELPYYLDRADEDEQYPTLLEMSRVSLNVLNRSYFEMGFFAMIEGSQMDSCGHNNDIACVLAEMQQFYETVEYVTQWAERDGDTLVVVLADHQTGGLAIGRQHRTAGVE